MSAYHVTLDQFTGPLDLLLHLIRTREMDIFDLDIARITDDYLQVMEREGVADLAGAYHFLALAAALVELKSRMLLPRPPGESAGDERAAELAEALEDPRTALAQTLAAYEQIQQSAAELAERYEQAGRHWPRKVTEDLEVGIVYLMDSVSVYDLMSAFREVLERPRYRQLTIIKEDYTAGDARAWLRQRLTPGPAAMLDVLGEQANLLSLIVTFIALLDMIKEEQLTFERQGNGIILSLSAGGTQP